MITCIFFNPESVYLSSFMCKRSSASSLSLFCVLDLEIKHLVLFCKGCRRRKRHPLSTKKDGAISLIMESLDQPALINSLLIPIFDWPGFLSGLRVYL